MLNYKPVFDGRLSVREIQRNVGAEGRAGDLSACETARGRQYAGGESFVGFTQALLMSGARSVCLSLWKVDDGDGPVDAAVLCQLAGSTHRAFAAAAQGRGARRGKGWLRG